MHISGFKAALTLHANWSVFLRWSLSLYIYSILVLSLPFFLYCVLYCVLFVSFLFSLSSSASLCLAPSLARSLLVPLLFSSALLASPTSLLAVSPHLASLLSWLVPFVAGTTSLPLALRSLPAPPTSLALTTWSSCSLFHSQLAIPVYTSLPLSEFVPSLHAHHQPLFSRVGDVTCGCQPDVFRGRAAGLRPLLLIPMVQSFAGGPSPSVSVSASGTSRAAQRAALGKSFR